MVDSGGSAATEFSFGDRQISGTAVGSGVGFGAGDCGDPVLQRGDSGGAAGQRQSAELHQPGRDPSAAVDDASRLVVGFVEARRERSLRVNRRPGRARKRRGRNTSVLLRRASSFQWLDSNTSGGRGRAAWACQARLPRPTGWAKRGRNGNTSATARCGQKGQLRCK